MPVPTQGQQRISPESRSRRRKSLVAVASWGTLTLAFTTFFGLWQSFNNPTSAQAAASANSQNSTLNSGNSDGFALHHHRDDFGLNDGSGNANTTQGNGDQGSVNLDPSTQSPDIVSSAS